MIGFWKFRRERPLWLYLFCMGAPVFLGYLLWSFHSRILPNWIAVSILPMFCLMVAYWSEKFRAGWRVGVKTGFHAPAWRWAFSPSPSMYQSNLIGKIAGQPLPGEKDPSRRVRGWSVEARSSKMRAKNSPPRASPRSSSPGITASPGCIRFTFRRRRAR